MTAAASVKEPRDLICRDPRIEAPSVWVTAYRADLRELCQRHGEDSGTVDLILYVIAAVCFALSAFEVTQRFHMVALGLLAWVCVPLLAAVQAR